MQKLNLLLIFFISLSIISCSSDDETTNIGSVVGTYNLISIVSDYELDPEVTGDFNDLELIDNISCSSAMTLNSDYSIDWNYLDLTQTLDGSTGVYTEITCLEIDDVSGTFEINYSGINFEFDSNVENLVSTSLSGSSITVKRTENLVVKTDGTVKKTDVELTFIFEEE